MSDIPSNSAPSAAGGVRPRWLVPAIVGSALFMQTLGATSITNALPTMAQALGESPLTLNLAITSYLLAAAIFLPISAWIADRFGARTIFLCAIVVFTLSSIACGFATNLTELIAARVVQGAASAMLMPVGRLLVLRNTPKSELVGALAVLTMPGLLGPMLGPPLGGAIVTFGDWRWIFFINAPIGIAALALVARYAPNVRESDRAPLDWIGFALTGVACAGLVFGFENIGRAVLPWPLVAGFLGIGALSAFLFVRHARRTTQPILDPTLLDVPTFHISLIGGAFLRFAMGASPFLLALLLQLGFAMSAFEAGLTTFVAATGAFVMKSAAPPIIKRFGFRRVLIWNGLICAGMFALYAFFTPAMPHGLLLAILLVAGFFRSLQFTSLNAIAFSDIPQARMSRASTLSSMIQQLSQSIGVGLAALLLHVSMHVQASVNIDVNTLSPVFAALAVITAMGHFWFVRLTPNAGAEVSGEKAKAVNED